MTLPQKISITLIFLCAIGIAATVVFATVYADNPGPNPECTDANGNDRVDIDELFDVIDAYFNGTSCLPAEPSPMATPGTPGTTSTPEPSPTPPSEEPSPTPDTDEESLSQMIERLRPSVVKLLNESGTRMGSGVIFKTDDQNAYIITNYHVVDNIIDVKVTVEDANIYDGTVVGVNPKSDLAVVRICCGTFTKADFGNSLDLNVGDPVVAIGYPFDDLQPTANEKPGRVIVPGIATVTMGIVSAFRYSTPRAAEIIQTDTPVNPGNSGGPLLNTAGQIVGINTFILSETEGLNYAISETTVQEHIPDLLDGKSPPEVVERDPIITYWPLAGPDAGHFHHDPTDSKIGRISLGVGIRSNVRASAWFSNPYNANDHPFSYGFMLRSNPQNHLRVYVHSNGNLYIVQWTREQGFQTPTTFDVSGLLRTEANQYNGLTVITLDNIVSVFLNGQTIADADGNTFFPLGPDTGPGYFYIINGVEAGSERQGAITLYDNLYVNALIYQTASQEEAMAELLDKMTRQRSIQPPDEHLHQNHN